MLGHEDHEDTGMSTNHQLGQVVGEPGTSPEENTRSTTSLHTTQNTMIKLSKQAEISDNCLFSYDNISCIAYTCALCTPPLHSPLSLYLGEGRKVHIVIRSTAGGARGVNKTHFNILTDFMFRFTRQAIISSSDWVYQTWQPI